MIGFGSLNNFSALRLYKNIDKFPACGVGMQKKKRIKHSLSTKSEYDGGLG
jgi:hypothetical protein